MKAIAIASGGMDSTTLLYHLLDRDAYPVAIGFDYGQRHRKELDNLLDTCGGIGVEARIVDLTNLTKMLAASGSSLVDPDSPVPEGHYAEDTMRATVVPNRNAIMLSIATGIAVAEKADLVATGVHAGDHYVYPDCRPEFLDAMREAMIAGNAGFAAPDFTLYAPFMDRTKAWIAARGHELGVDWTKTWSCYLGGDLHCGRCGTCVERWEAFRVAGVPDPTTYADPDYAATVTAKAGTA